MNKTEKPDNQGSWFLVIMPATLSLIGILGWWLSSSSQEAPPSPQQMAIITQWAQDPEMCPVFVKASLRHGGYGASLKSQVMAQRVIDEVAYIQEQSKWQLQFVSDLQDAPFIARCRLAQQREGELSVEELADLAYQ